jgi:hypothetical protein
MSDEATSTTQDKTPQAAKPGRFLGSLKDALAAASRDDTHRGVKNQSAPAATAAKDATQRPSAIAGGALKETAAAGGATPSAAEAAREVKSQTSLSQKPAELAAPPTTRVVRAAKPADADDAPRTQLVRGKARVERGTFERDPVVGWLVIVGGPGIGNYRPIFEGNNTVGRSSSQRIPIDFGDESISSEEQAYIRYDSSARSFLFVPNLAKTNVVSLNDKRPTGAVELNQMDVITMGRTQLVFVPFCGAEFDWSELTDAND